MPIRTFPVPLQILVCSRAQAVYRQAASTEAIVSIRTPGDAPVTLSGYAAVLALECHPLPSGVTPQWATRWGGWHVRSLLTFIDELPPNVQTLVIHCSEGQVRSAGVAAGLLEAWGRDDALVVFEEQYPRYSRDIKEIIAHISERWKGSAAESQA